MSILKPFRLADVPFEEKNLPPFNRFDFISVVPQPEEIDPSRLFPFTGLKEGEIAILHSTRQLRLSQRKDLLPLGVGVWVGLLGIEGDKIIKFLSETWDMHTFDLTGTILRPNEKGKEVGYQEDHYIRVNTSSDANFLSLRSVHLVTSTPALTVKA